MERSRSSFEQASAALERIALGAVAVTTRALAMVGVELTFAQWRAMVIVGEREVGATVTEVAERLGSEISPTSRLVRRLVARGFVVTQKDDADRRVTRVAITPAGAAIRRAVLERRRMVLDQVLAGAGEVDPSIAAFLDRIGDGFRGLV
jgi:DNA-binding MarR family transcriptional regulator